MILELPGGRLVYGNELSVLLQTALDAAGLTRNVTVCIELSRQDRYRLYTRIDKDGDPNTTELGTLLLPKE